MCVRRDIRGQFGYSAWKKRREGRRAGKEEANQVVIQTHILRLDHPIILLINLNLLNLYLRSFRGFNLLNMLNLHLCLYLSLYDRRLHLNFSRLSRRLDLGCR